MRLGRQPITFREACEFVRLHHRTHKAPQGCKACVGLTDGERVIGVAIVGRPTARHLDDGWTGEVTRDCVLAEYKNAASKMSAAGRRLIFALGYSRAITYTLPEESGVSMRAAGWRLVGEAGGGTWNRTGRPRVDKHPTGQKLLWERTQ